MPRFTAPKDVSSITLEVGEVHAVDGVIEVHVLSADDVAALSDAGFEMIAQGCYFALPAAPQEPDQ